MQYNHFQIMQIMNKINSKFETLIGQNIAMEGNEGNFTQELLIVRKILGVYFLREIKLIPGIIRQIVYNLYANFQRNFLFLLIR